MKKVDYLVHIIYIVIILALSVVWGYKYDILITVLGVMIATASGAATYYQYKKLKELEGMSEQDNQYENQ